eukprot:c6870_g1_i1.p1 GENE.c6870_g1_i1~~c6870_g1_i1.p1  ORF type:complete len:489 (-),score=121.30 c6870_g1_i1:200-1666(-)
MMPPPDEAIRMKGLLWKKARGRSMASAIYKPWALRWFVLQGNVLAYYDQKEGLSGTVSTRKSSLMVAKGALNVVGATVDRDLEATKPNCFVVQGCKSVEDGSEETLYLAAADAQEMGEWMAVLSGSTRAEGWRWIVDRKASGGMPPALRKAVSRTANRLALLYDVKEQLGTGGFSVVKKGICREDGKVYALKMIPLDVFQKNRLQAEDEVRVLAALDHPGIVKLKEVIRTPTHFVIVMECLRGGELFERIVERRKYSEYDAKLTAAKILDALRYLHENDIVHRDVKPENMMFDSFADDAALKLTDFGFAAMYDRSNRLTATCGTPEYVAPEVILERAYGSAVDMWSMGVVLYILLCGFPPFYGETDEIMFDRICHARYHFIRPHWDNISKEAKHLIRHLLDLDPEKRYTAQQALDHPWFNDVVSGPSTSQPISTDLITVLSELKRYNAFRKFRRGVLAVIAANKLAEGFRVIFQRVSSQASSPVDPDD